MYVCLFDEAVTFSRLYGLTLVTEDIYGWGHDDVYYDLGPMTCTMTWGLVVQGIKCRGVWWHQEGEVVH